MKTFTLTEETANNLLNYLGEQKFVDVAPLIQALLSLELIEPQVTEDQQPKEDKK